jgi:twitching motility protein PilI
VSKLDLRSFQQEISERLAAARRAGSEPPRLGFTAGGTRYALPLADIAEVAPLVDVKRVPGSEPWFLGVTNIRGSVLALTHLGALLHRAAPGASAASRVLVLGGQFARLRCGVLVDSVAGLRTIASTEPLAVPGVAATLSGIDTQDGTWTLLDVTRLMSSTQFFDVSAHQTPTAA